MKPLKNFNSYLDSLKVKDKINQGNPYIVEGVDIVPLATSLVDFMSRNGVSFGRKIPFVIFSSGEEVNQNSVNPIFKRTGHFNFLDKVINIFTDGRSTKDILRTLAHELIHADQVINKNMDVAPALNGLGKKNNSEAEKIEGDAYLRGNILFRRWEDTLRGKYETKK